jgi:hypothetical protein
MDIKDLESIAKIVLGSGLLGFLIAEIWRAIRNKINKSRITKEIAFGFFLNEFTINLIIADYQILQKYPTEYLRHHRFNTQITDAVISSIYFANLNFDLVQLIVEFNQRFQNIQCEIDGFFRLEDEEKLRNVAVLPQKIRNAKVLLSDLQNSKKYKRIKKKYYKKYVKTRKDVIEERFGLSETKNTIKEAKNETTKKRKKS